LDLFEIIFDVKIEILACISSELFNKWDKFV
jgi:hypothetical protein